mgnify:CR=1 FL=1
MIWKILSHPLAGLFDHAAYGIFAIVTGHAHQDIHAFDLVHPHVNVFPER